MRLIVTVAVREQPVVAQPTEQVVRKIDEKRGDRCRRRRTKAMAAAEGMTVKEPPVKAKRRCRQNAAEARSEGQAAARANAVEERGGGNTLAQPDDAAKDEGAKDAGTGRIETMALCALLAACGSKGRRKPAGRPFKPGAAPAPEVGKIAQEKFQAASASFKEMQKAGNVDYAALEAQYRDVIKTDPSFYEAFYNLGVVAEQQGHPELAIKNYESALALNGKFAPPIENIAAIDVAQGKIDDAISTLEKFIQSNPTSAAPRVQLARLYLGKKKFDDAASQCRAALQREPKNLSAFETLAVTYVQADNRPMAKLVAARGFKVDASSAPLHYTMGKIDLEENKIPEAVAEFKSALQAKPDLRPARIDLAEVALSYRDFGNAKANYADLVKIDQNDEPSWIGLGIANKGLGQFEDAKAAYQHVLESDAKNPVALMNMAILYHRNLNDFAGALKYYKLYLDSRPTEGPASDGPKPEVVKGYVTELEQTIAALKEAEKLQQMQDAQQKQPEQQPSSEQPAGGGGEATPASAPAGETK